MSHAGSDLALEQLLGEQQAYYRARAPRYLQSALAPLESREAAALQRDLGGVFDAHFRGDVLELACGPGTWTAMLADRARTLTAVDGAPEMLALAAERAGRKHVRFIESDLFSWTPERTYDAAFFGFWLSHVPDARFDGFWAKIGECLSPGGWVAFVDDAYRTEDELVYGADSSVIQRRLEDGSTHRIVKVPHTPSGLQRRLSGLGWQFEVTDVPPFFWGVGRPTRP